MDISRPVLCTFRHCNLIKRQQRTSYSLLSWIYFVHWFIFCKIPITLYILGYFSYDIKWKFLEKITMYKFHIRPEYYIKSFNQTLLSSLICLSRLINFVAISYRISKLCLPLFDWFQDQFPHFQINHLKTQQELYHENSTNQQN